MHSSRRVTTAQVGRSRDAMRCRTECIVRRAVCLPARVSKCSHRTGQMHSPQQSCQLALWHNVLAATCWL